MIRAEVSVYPSIVRVTRVLDARRRCIHTDRVFSSFELDCTFRLEKASSSVKCVP